MEIVNNLRLSGSQNLVMNQRLQKALWILQLSHQELCDYLDEQALQNPLLNFVKENEINNFNSENSQNSPNEYESDLIFQKSAYGNDGEILPVLEHQKNISLHETLQQQINIHIKSPVEKIIADTIVEETNESGYWLGKIENIANMLGVKIDQVAKVLQTMQDFEPIGIFAQSLRQNLIIQLKDRGIHTQNYELIIDFLQKKPNLSLEKMAKELNIEIVQCAQIMKTLKTLKPYPLDGWNMDNGVNLPRIPDVFVYWQGGDIKVELNLSIQPKILLNSSYYHDLKKALVVKKGADYNYLQKCYNEANWLINSLQQRANNLKNVACAIVDHQMDFFIKGIQSLRPLNIKKIAQTVNLNESTVSRITQEKYIKTPRGIFNLKFFFTNALNKMAFDLYDENDGCNFQQSVASVRDMLKEIITKEASKKPFSDDQIVNIFAQKGINLARRTVSKYRSMLGIPSSYERKTIL